MDRGDGPSRPSARTGGLRNIAFGLAVLVAFFSILEAALWAAGVEPLLSERDPFEGFSRRVRVFEPDPSRGVYRTPARAVRHSFNYQEFSARKPPNGFRVFTLGGSSAYGFPWGARVAFTRVLGEALQATFPDRVVEAINAAGMSYGSHRLRILAHEVLDYEPDVLVVFEGHNEFVEQRFYRDVLERPRRLDALRGALYRWRVYAAAARLYERGLSATGRGGTAAGRAAGRTAAELLGLDVEREYATAVTDAKKEEARARFEENLRAILEEAERSGVRVVLCTVPSNLSDWAPNESFFGAEVGLEARQQVSNLLARAREALEGGRAAEAAAALEAARARAPGHAEVHFRLGEAYERLGRFEEAREAFRRARDADGKPSRALSSFNDTIRGLAGAGGAILVDVERAFEEASANGLVGFDLIEDYVHPKPEAHRRIALELWRAFLEHGLVGGRRLPADPERFWAAVGHASDEPDAASAGEAATPALLFNLGVVLENQGHLERAMEKYRACLDRDPTYTAARYNLGRLLHRQGRFPEAAEEHRRVLETDPGFVLARIGLGEALRRLGRIADAVETFQEAVRADPAAPLAWDGLGGSLAQLGRYPEAEAAFRRAVELDPKSASYRANLGFALLFQKKLGEAEAVLREAFRLAPDDLQARNGLAAVLLERGALGEAEGLFRDTIRLRPEDSFARSGLEEVRRRRGR